jgi:hypothetical protein
MQEKWVRTIIHPDQARKIVRTPFSDVHPPSSLFAAAWLMQMWRIALARLVWGIDLDDRAVDALVAEDAKRGREFLCELLLEEIVSEEIIDAYSRLKTSSAT